MDIDEIYRASGWGLVTDQALGIPPSGVESQARAVAQWAHTEITRLQEKVDRYEKIIREAGLQELE